MIINCINCNKKFEVNSELIPSEGRTIQCGSCNHIWFYKHNIQLKKDLIFPDKIKDEPNTKNIIKNKDKDIELKKSKKNLTKEIDEIINKKEKSLVKYQNEKKFTFSKFLSFILVLIISFVGLIIVVDTFKTPIYQIFPNLEILLFSLFEILKDIKLFIKDLI